MHAASAEFKLIQTFFQRQAEQQSNDVARLGIGDDCAILTPKINTELAISVDTSIANVHFPDNASAGQIAARALNVALSDLAAMGAKPLAFTLALSLPKHYRTYRENTSASFLSEFSLGLFDAAKKAGVKLIGGDTTQADMPLSVSVTVYGELPTATGLQRCGAKVGDTIYISRPTGEAGAGLALWMAGKKEPKKLINAYINPQPELELGQKLLTLANSCIDVSDG
ncbi:MAG: thiamine-phosphate kinase, partial [Sinobacterium sp.]|nr:thiamine-phosphate kinase [Sinobacterium sp.]